VNKLIIILFAISTAMLNLMMISCTDKNPETEKASVEKEAAAQPPVVIQDDVNEGAEIFKENCRVCHGPGGKGDICPNLTDDVWKYGNSDADLFYSIAKGRPGGMPNWETKMGEEKIRKVMTYIRSISRK
jgi:cbb3-type cytochrome c oxidase subunit III